MTRTQAQRARPTRGESGSGSLGWAHASAGPILSKPFRSPADQSAPLTRWYPWRSGCLGARTPLRTCPAPAPREPSGDPAPIAERALCWLLLRARSSLYAVPRARLRRDRATPDPQARRALSQNIRWYPSCLGSSATAALTRGGPCASVSRGKPERVNCSSMNHTLPTPRTGLRQVHGSRVRVWKPPLGKVSSSKEPLLAPAPAPGGCLLALGAPHVTRKEAGTRGNDGAASHPLREGMPNFTEVCIIWTKFPKTEGSYVAGFLHI